MLLALEEGESLPLKQRGNDIFSAVSDYTYQITAARMGDLLSYDVGSLKQGKADDVVTEKDYDETSCYSAINVSASAADPLVTFLWIPVAPSISEKLVVGARRDRDGGVTLTMWGTHSEFPSYELLVDQQLVMGYNTTAALSFRNLVSPMPFGKYEVKIGSDGKISSVSSGPPVDILGGETH